jgi:hypothetical protein
LSAFFGYKVVSLFQESEFHSVTVAGVTTQVQNAGIATQAGAEPGLFKFQDTDGDGIITPADRVFIGNPNPKFTFGFNMAFTYKNFDVSAFLYGSSGNDIFNSNRYFTDFYSAFQGQKSKDLLYNSWTPDNVNAKTPKATSVSSFSNDQQVNSYYIENGSFMRMKTLELGYTIPESVMNKINIKGLRVYVQAVNLFTVTKYTGLDPELGGDDRAFGSDTGNYPIVKNFIFGLNLNF